jgi:hypothetical protein
MNSTASQSSTDQTWEINRSRLTSDTYCNDRESRLMLEVVTGPRDKQTAQQLLAGAAERLAVVVERRLGYLPVIPARPPVRGHSHHTSEAGRNGGSFRRAKSLKYFIEFVMSVVNETLPGV